MLLGAVTPWGVRIVLFSVNTGDRTAGSLYAVGSILGTLAPVLWPVPSYGTRRPFLLIGLWLVLLALCGAPWVARRRHATGFVGVLMIEGRIGTLCADTTRFGGAANRATRNTSGVRLPVRGPRKLNGTEMPASPATGPRVLEAACSLSLCKERIDGASCIP